MYNHKNKNLVSKLDFLYVLFTEAFDLKKITIFDMVLAVDGCGKCPALHHSGMSVILIMCLILFLPLAHNHPTGVFVSQGSCRAAYHSCADVSG